MNCERCGESIPDGLRLCSVGAVSKQLTSNLIMRTIKMTFRNAAKQYAGKILIISYAGKSLAFSPLATPLPSEIKCECGHSVWNATNFSNPIHFCPDKEIEFFASDYSASCGVDMSAALRAATNSLQAAANWLARSVRTDDQEIAKDCRVIIDLCEIALAAK